MTDEELLQLIKQTAEQGVANFDLSFKRLTSLPMEIGCLQNLAKLSINRNKLSALPPEIGQLRNLATLDLQVNLLNVLIPEIGELQNLTTLRLNNNLLNELPSEIRQLRNLIFFDLSRNSLNTLPPAIGQLESLTILDLHNNQLNKLPFQIGQLKNLATFDLSRNLLNTLPSTIGQLENLTSLDLSNNQISFLPAEIGQLKNLTSLDLSNNQISFLPAEIGQLKNLVTLNLTNNLLNILPPEIERLQNLQSLSISYNQLHALPPEIGQLRNLTTLNFNENPLESPPPEILKKDIRAIKRYLKQLKVEGKDFLYEAKMLILGEPGAGKTSLAKKIEHPDYLLQENERSTEGIEVIQWCFLLMNGKEFRVNIWDFGGQEIYHATHQFFLTKRSLYTLVADTRKEDTDFYYWLNIVELLSDNSPLLIIKNEKQDRKREINERQLRQFTNLKETLATNLKTNRGIPEILNKIQHHISTLPHVGAELPKTWVKVRKTLERKRRNYISLKEYLAICRKNSFIAEDALQLCGYLHDLGVCLHFQADELLRRIVILKPAWGTAAAYKVLDNPQVVQNLGRFTRTDLAHIWHEDQYADMRAELLKLMMNFKLCYEIPGAPGTYIAPQLLTENQPDYTWDASNNLMLRYEYEFMPKGILTRFIVETHSLIDSQSYVWRSGVVLKQDQARAEVIEHYRYHKGEIWVRVSGKRKKELMAIVRHELKQIHASYGDRLRKSELVPCNCSTCKDSQTPHFYRLEDLNRRLDNKRYQVECEQSYKSVEVRSLIDEVITRNSDDNKPLSMPQPTVRDQVFISYSHKDQQWLEALQIHLRPMIRNQTLKPWDDTQIKPGAEWRKEITAALAAAKVAVLLVSPDFLASDFIDKNELPPLLDAAENEGLTIIWIPIRASAYKVTAIEKYQSAHPPNQPLARLNNDDRDQAWVDICEKIQAAANS
ncbi:MAG: leucine-rich repeat domain-containing protein [Stenomitos rutilans HA7619-LM2]|nr:leucine-rich repeat domain-containing protein [Stenomitos rutilans HA7619-LM2]